MRKGVCTTMEQSKRLLDHGISPVDTADLLYSCIGHNPEILENEAGAGSENSRSGKTLRKIMNIVTERYQTEQEARDASLCNRMFTSYYVFLDDKKIGGSLKRALQANSDADRKNVSEDVRMKIKQQLKGAFMAAHIGYREPEAELELPFDGG